MPEKLTSLTEAILVTKQANIKIDAGDWRGELPHNWNYIGYDEINYTYTPEGEELLGKFMAMQEKPYYVRAHHLLCTGNGHSFYKWGSTNAYLEDESGTPIYDWALVDLTFDTILKYRCKPFVELGFMPLHLTDPAHYDPAQDKWNYPGYKACGFAAPPKDYQKWHDLIYALVQHCAERYGAAEIESWYWELWNEPDLDYYWKGSIDEFNKLYDYTAAAVKAACPGARVGGPGTTNPIMGRRSAEYLDKFLDHCTNGTNAVTGLRGTPIDFTSFHVKGGGYRADPLHRRQNPPSVNHILNCVKTGHEIIRKYPGMAQLECVLTEIDPDGWAAGGAWDNVNLNFRNTEYYASFVASAFDQVSRYARDNNWDLRLLTWAFMFVGERCFEGTRTFSTQGIDKAILNLFRMYARMGHEELAFSSSAAPEVAGFATLSGSKSLQALIYHHHDDWDAEDVCTIKLEIDRLPFESRDLTIMHYRIDASHSNAYTEWVRQGKPMYPTPGQRDAIKARDGLELLEPPQKMMLDSDGLALNFTLPMHGISLLIISSQ
jgi:xylan 1,4-beta-xylosidase